MRLTIRATVWLATVTVAGLASPIAGAQWFHQPAVGIPRTADGKPDLNAPAPRAADGRPDLSGRWQRRVLASTANDDDLLPWAKAVIEERRENFFRDSPQVMCLPLGPMAIAGVSPVKMVQAAGLLTTLRDDLTFRQIFLDGRELPSDPNPSWMGYSVGRWVDDTLIVQSIGFTERSWLANNYPHSEDLRITERYRRRSLGHMDLQVTVDDPKTFRKPWTVTVAMQLDPDTEFLEYVCNENEKSRARMVGRLSDDKAAAVDVDPALLDTYTGTYKARRPDGVPVTFEITREDRSLVVQTDRRAKVKLVPISTTRFRGQGPEFEFFADATGAVTHFTRTNSEGRNIAIRKR